MKLNDIGLKLNVGKTKVISSEPNKEYITISNLVLEFVDEFTYLGSVVNLHGGTEEDIPLRLGKARAAFAHMTPVWKSSTYSRKTKLRLYRSNVLSVLLYGSECWRMTEFERDNHKLATYHTTCLRRIMRVFWPNKTSNGRLLHVTG